MPKLLGNFVENSALGATHVLVHAVHLALQNSLEQFVFSEDRRFCCFRNRLSLVYLVVNPSPFRTIAER
jgi:hypothetical protein